MLVFGYQYDKESEFEIDIRKEGKYLYLHKFNCDDKEYRMDLTNGEFERINFYKKGIKITPVKVKNITNWFTDCSLFCDDEKFCKVILYNKYHAKFRRYKSPIRFIQLLSDWRARHYEQWLSVGIEITNVKKKIDVIKTEKTYGWNYHNVDIYKTPSDISKSGLKYIQKHFKEISTEAIDALIRLDNNGFKLELIDKLYEKSCHPKYSSFFNFKIYEWQDENKRFNIFDLTRNTEYTGLRIMKNLIKSINDFNLDVDTFFDFCLRLYNTEAITIKDMFDTNHYYDYLSIEKKLKNLKQSKMDKYPQYFLSTFHLIKEEYRRRKEEIDEASFKHECNRFRFLEDTFKDYSIMVPNCSQDIRDEADELKHCVAGYIPRVVRGETLICFLRHNDNLNIPLVTIEVKDGHVTQAYGNRDSKPTYEQLTVLRKWAKKHELRLSWAWG